MSAAVRIESALPVTEEASARHASVTAPTSSPAPHRAPELQALPKLSRRRKSAVSGVIALLVLALAVVLGINIHVSSSQYMLVQLQNERTALVQQNQSLSESVRHQQSPQVLSNNAVALGMVLPSTAGSLDLGTGEVTGSAEAAENGNRPSSFVATPDGAGLGSEPAQNISEQLAGSPAGILGYGALDTLMGASGVDNETGESGTVHSGQDSSVKDLNGGTIPAPSL